MFKGILQFFSTFGVLGIILFYALVGYGWCHNIYSLAVYATHGGNLTLMASLRALGIVVAPLGAVLGYF